MILSLRWNVVGQVMGVLRRSVGKKKPIRHAPDGLLFFVFWNAPSGQAA